MMSEDINGFLCLKLKLHVKLATVHGKKAKVKRKQHKTQTSPLLVSKFHINEINIPDISFKTNCKPVAKKLLPLATLTIHDV